MKTYKTPMFKPHMLNVGSVMLGSNSDSKEKDLDQVKNGEQSNQDWEEKSFGF